MIDVVTYLLIDIDLKYLSVMIRGKKEYWEFELWYLRNEDENTGDLFKAIFLRTRINGYLDDRNDDVNV